MGTRYEDQPPEHWAGPESLDPTPVWRQFLVFGILALSALGIIAVVSYLALAPMFVTPPALVPGGRLVLSREQAYQPPGDPLRIVVGPGPIQIREPFVIGPGGTLSGGEDPPRAPNQESLWLSRIGDDEYVAVSGEWRHPDTGEVCPVGPTMGWLHARADPSIPAFGTFGSCARLGLTFGARGEPLTAPRGLDRYLVSVEGDRVIVNLSREIRGFGATPQPLVSPLGTPVQTRRP